MTFDGQKLENFINLGLECLHYLWTGNWPQDTKLHKTACGVLRYEQCDNLTMWQLAPFCFYTALFAFHQNCPMEQIKPVHYNSWQNQLPSIFTIIPLSFREQRVVWTASQVRHNQLQAKLIWILPPCFFNKFSTIN